MLYINKLLSLVLTIGIRFVIRMVNRCIDPYADITLPNKDNVVVVADITIAGAFADKTARAILHHKDIKGKILDVKNTLNKDSALRFRLDLTYVSYMSLRAVIEETSHAYIGIVSVPLYEDIIKPIDKEEELNVETAT